MNALFEWGSYLTYSALWRLVRLLPEKLAYRIFDLLAEVAYRRNGRRVTRLRENYKRVRPNLSNDELETMVRAGLKNAMRYWCDTFRISDWSPEQAAQRVISTNEELLHEGMKSGKGVIIAVPHAGNWDHAGAYFCATGIPLTTVAEHLEPEKLFKKFLTYRENIGMEVLDLNSRSIATLSQRARAGKLIALVADRDISNNGVPVEFCRADAKLPAGPALLAIQTGAALITAYIRYEVEGIRIIFGPEILVPNTGDVSQKVKFMTQEIANRFGAQLQKDPVDWHMLQRIWA